LRRTIVFVFLAFICACFETSGNNAEENHPDSLITVIDGLGRSMQVPWNPDHVICSGPGCLRLLVYLQAQDRVVAVDDMEGRRDQFDARPYFLANPWLGDLPVFGEFRGHDNPELILALNPQPQVIFKTYPEMGMDPQELQEKTGIPVVVLSYGDLGSNRDQLNSSLRIMGTVLNREERAEEVLSFFDSTIQDLHSRSELAGLDSLPSCYIGGIAYRGPHGFQSTEPGYLPFKLIGMSNIALDYCTGPEEHADVAKEQIVAWNPDFIFLDISTLQCDPQTSALYQLQNDPAYSFLSGDVYGMLPYNWYTENFGSTLANAYFAGSVLIPDGFTDVDPKLMADSIYTFLVGQPVFESLNQGFSHLAFARILPDDNHAP